MVSLKEIKMKNIAIFVSGDGRSALRIIKLFNEGNRVHTSLLFADDSAAPILENLQATDVKAIHIPDEEWHGRSNEVAALLKENDIKLLVLDNFGLALSDEIMETTDGEILRVSNEDLAPREVVNALEAELRRQSQIPEPTEEPEVQEGEPTLESEWADKLNIRYTPPKVPNRPPNIPGNNEGSIQESPKGESGPSYSPQGEWNQREYSPQEPYSSGGFQYHHNNHHPYRSYGQEEEGMPSTWLIWSILVTVFCCFIPGIIAIIFSSQVSTRYYAGDREGAKRASKNAEAWIIVSVVLGVLAATLYLPFMIISN